MVHTPILYKNNVVLLGDAGYCPTPLSGMGASLSIYGAKALANFIDNSPDDLKKALDGYNNLMQPIIQKFQSNARKNARTFLPLGQTKLWLMNLIFKLVPLSSITRKMNNELTLTDNQRNFIVEN